MGMVVGGFDEETFNKKPKMKYYEGMKEDVQNLLFTSEKMSHNIVRIIDELANNEHIYKLLSNPTDSPFDPYDDPEKEKASQISFENKDIAKNNGPKQQIFAFPFSIEAKTNYDVNIRVYYNEGTFRNNGIMTNAQMNVDIICSQRMWLYMVKKEKLRLIRPYSIMNQIVNNIFRAETSNILGRPVGYNHFTVNSKYECIRIYVNTDDMERQRSMLPNPSEEILSGGSPIKEGE